MEERRELKNLKNNRKLINDIVTFGFNSRKDYKEKKIINSANYDLEIQRFNSLYLDDDFWSSAAAKSIKSDYFQNISEKLAAIYFLHAIKDEKITRILFALYMAQTEQSVSASRLNNLQQAICNAKGLPEFGSYIDTGSEAYNKTASYKRTLDDLHRNGYLSLVKENGQKTFIPDTSLTDILDALPDSEIKRLYYFIDFFAQAGYPRGAGIYLRNAFKRYLRWRKLSFDVECFHFLNNSSRSIFDENIIYTFIQAINQQNKVELTYTPDTYLQSKTKTASEPAQTKIVLSPVHIRADIRFGRYFIFGVNESGAAKSFKISNIDDIKILEKEHFNLPEAQAAVQNTFANSIISPRILPEAPYDVILKFYQKPQPNNAAYRFLNECRTGELIDDDTYKITINDPVEIYPLLRKYGSALQILHGEIIDEQNGDLADKRYNEYKNMLQKYEEEE